MATVLITGSIDIEAIKDQYPLASIVEQHVALKKVGKEWRGLCPFHSERTPSFYIIDEKQFYHCFGCGAHGDVFDWLRETQGLDIREAAEHLTGGIALPAYTPERIEELRRKQAQFEAEEVARRQQATAAATERWMGADPGFFDHPYLERKRIQPHGTRREGDLLLIPLIGEDAKIQTLQSIDPDGRKLFVNDAPVSGGFFVIGGKVVSAEGPVILCEGFATAASIHEATSCVTVCAFNAGNMGNVADILARKYPDKDYIVAGDDDRGKNRNVGREAAIEAAATLKCRAVLPAFADDEGTDFNDMVLAVGAEAVRTLIIDGRSLDGEQAEAPIEAGINDVYQTLSLDELEALPPPTYLIEDLIPEHGLTIVYGDPGAKKSFLTLDMALRIAHGMDWHGTTAKRCGVLYIAGEGRHGLGKRVKGWRREHGLQGVDAPFKLLPVAVHMLDKASVEKLKRTIAAVAKEVGFDVCLVIIDTVSRAIAGQDENKQDAMSLFVDGCADIQDFTSGAVVGVHHSGKDRDRGMRGSSVLLGGCDAAIRVIKDELTATIEVEKQKDAEEKGPFHMAFKEIEWSEGLAKASKTLVPEKTEKQTLDQRTLNRRQADQIFKLVDEAWTQGNPWSAFPQAKRKGRYLIDHIVSEYEVSARVAEDHVIGWQAREYMKSEAGGSNKQAGLRVLKYLEEA